MLRSQPALSHARLTMPQAAPPAPDNGCQRVEESGLRDVTTERAEDVLDSCADCVVCWEQCADVVFQPCGHLCTCSACVAACLGSTFLCPMCRCTVADSIHI